MQCMYMSSLQPTSIQLIMLEWNQNSWLSQNSFITFLKFYAAFHSLHFLFYIFFLFPPCLKHAKAVIENVGSLKNSSLNLFLTLSPTSSLSVIPLAFSWRSSHLSFIILTSASDSAFHAGSAPSHRTFFDRRLTDFTLVWSVFISSCTIWHRGRETDRTLARKKEI